MSSTAKRVKTTNAKSSANANPLGGRPITEDCKVFSCRMCRKFLFTSNDLMAHDSTKDAKGHKRFKFQTYHADEQKSVCTSLFLDPDVATWVARESRETQTRRLEEMEKERVAIEDEEIFGPGGRPKTPPLDADYADDDDEDRFGDDFDNHDEDQGTIEIKEKQVAKARNSDDDSDEEIISSDDESAKKKSSKTQLKKSAAPVKKAAPAYLKTAPAPAAKAAASDSDEEIISDDDDEKRDSCYEQDEDDFDDDDDFKSNFGGGHNERRRKEARVAKAALDIVDPDTIYCPYCTCKIGAQNWIGSQCSCAAWVTPSFKVHAKAVDEIPGSLYMRLYQ